MKYGQNLRSQFNQFGYQKAPSVSKSLKSKPGAMKHTLSNKLFMSEAPKGNQIISHQDFISEKLTSKMKTKQQSQLAARIDSESDNYKIGGPKSISNDFNNLTRESFFKNRNKLIRDMSSEEEIGRPSRLSDTLQDILISRERA